MSLTFFTDRDLGRQFPKTLSEAGLTVVQHADLFPPEATDEAWLQRVGSEGWMAVTHDSRIRYKPNELGAVVRSNVGLLVVIGKARLHLLALNFVATFPKIQNFVATQSRPFIAKVYRPAPAILLKNPAAPGSVDLWYPRPD